MFYVSMGGGIWKISNLLAVLLSAVRRLCVPVPVHRWSRDFGLEASGPGKQESKFDGESKPLK